MPNPLQNVEMHLETQEIKIMLLVTKGPYSSQEPYDAYKYASFLLDEGISPVIFHFMDGIYNLSRLPIFALNFDKINSILEKLIDRGAKIIACSRCLLARGFWDENQSDIEERKIIPSNILQNVEIFGIQKLLEFISNGYKVIKF